jgi:hypothetical protein
VFESTTAEFSLGFNFQSFRRFVRSIVQFIRNPVLTRKYRKLLVQIRFHELKYHFIESNKLPLTLKVSDYLKRSERHVLAKLVHISTFAWLLLTGCVTLIYFLCGVIVLASNGSNHTVGVALLIMSYTTMLIFVVASLLIFNKMIWIFNRIMTMKLMSRDGNGYFISGRMGNDGTVCPEVQCQLDLFWGG